MLPYFVYYCVLPHIKNHILNISCQVGMHYLLVVIKLRLRTDTHLTQGKFNIVSLDSDACMYKWMWGSSLDGSRRTWLGVQCEHALKKRLNKKFIKYGYVLGLLLPALLSKLTGWQSLSDLLYLSVSFGAEMFAQNDQKSWKLKIRSTFWKMPPSPSSIQHVYGDAMVKA